jgi:hydrogenase small subunit
VAFRVPMHATVDIDRPTPPDTYPPIHARQGGVSPVATGVAGAILGALAGAGYVASKKLSLTPIADPPPPKPEE